MSLLDQLLSAGVRKATPRTISGTYQRFRIKPNLRDSEAKYRAFMLGEKRTVAEVAEHMGYTKSGVRSSFKDMIHRGQVIALKETRVSKCGREQKLFTWNPEFSA